MSDVRAAERAEYVTLDAAVNPTRGIYVGVSGNLNVTMANGDDRLFTNVPVGVLDISVISVFTTDTTASGLLLLY